jgi:uncharacterized protein YkwD
MIKNFRAPVTLALAILCALFAFCVSEARAANLATDISRLIDAERQKAGLPAFKYDAPLADAALQRARELKSVCEHTRPDGRNYDTVFAEYGVAAYRTSGENILWGSGISDAADAVAAWMDSPGHRANILKRSFTHAAIAYVKNGDEMYFVQLFLGR